MLHDLVKVSDGVAVGTGVAVASGVTVGVFVGIGVEVADELHAAAGNIANMNSSSLTG